MSDDQSARLGLPYLAAGQMQKHVTLNEALTRLDALVQTAVVSRSLAVQPAEPVDGALYILPANASGEAWAARPEGALMRAEAGGWTVVDVPDGLVVLVLDAAEVVIRHGGAWVPLGERLDAIQNLSRLGLGTTADAANPFAARLNKALWTAVGVGEGGDGDLRLTLNKEGPSDVLSLLFQSGWGGRAELGLIGDDDLRLKVSADGGSWRDVWSVDRDTGRISFERGASRREVTVFTADDAYAVPSWARTLEAVAIGGGGGGGAGAFAASGDRYGGGGGGAGGISRAVWPAELLADGLTVSVGAGGAGGDAAAGDDGGDSTIHLGATVLLTAVGGGGGGGGLGDAVSGLGGAGAAGMPVSNGGGASSVASAGGAGSGLDRPDGPGGGGGGGGLDASDAPRSGGAGGDGGALAIKADGGAGGSGSPGQPGAASPHPDLHWAGGGGGGGAAVASGAGHDGGPGGAAGGGGGGGGAGVSAGGAGGAGASGRVWLIAQG